MVLDLNRSLSGYEILDGALSSCSAQNIILLFLLPLLSLRNPIFEFFFLSQVICSFSLKLFRMFSVSDIHKQTVTCPGVTFPHVPVGTRWCLLKFPSLLQIWKIHLSCFFKYFLSSQAFCALIPIRLSGFSLSVLSCCLLESSLMGAPSSPVPMFLSPAMLVLSSLVFHNLFVFPRVSFFKI